MTGRALVTPRFLVAAPKLASARRALDRLDQAVHELHRAQVARSYVPAETRPMCRPTRTLEELLACSWMWPTSARPAGEYVGRSQVEPPPLAKDLRADGCPRLFEKRH